MTVAAVAPELESRLAALREAGWALFDKFDHDVRDQRFHPFVAANYESVLEALIATRAPGLKFLEWGSATGVITIMADLLGYEAYGIELDASLVETARKLAARFDSKAQFVAGSFLPEGYAWKPKDGDGRLGTIGQGRSGYLELGKSLDEFDVVFGYPWGGEEAMMQDLMRCYGAPTALLMVHGTDRGMEVYRDGKKQD
ncbi:MAG: class I SAM-dependent methyltransferase [Gemmatimonadales bacterium]|nr:MAG: class I SAM-dependent methyltransferase [Gemmatimonadales bacterium]